MLEVGAMNNPQFIYFAIAALLFLLCLPLPATRKLILELFTWTLRLSIIALLAAGVFLWYQPQRLPSDCANFVNSSPELSRYLPAPGTPEFGIAAACFIAAVSIPCLCRLSTMAHSAAPAVVVSEPAVAVPVARPARRGELVVQR
jgi:hypothetical protein